jgi:hypothetical protein
VLERHRRRREALVTLLDAVGGALMVVFELSPLLTAMNASASWMPASSRVWRSNPSPTIVFALNPGGSLSKADGFLSMIVTS